MAMVPGFIWAVKRLRLVLNSSGIEKVYFLDESEKEINAYISKETDEDGRKPISGLLEPQCMNCSEENIFRDIFQMIM